MIRHIVHIIYILFLFTAVKVYSQNEVNVVTQKTEHIFPYKENNVIKFSAIKSNIKINGWDRNEVKIIASAVAKNKDEKQAKKELEYIKYYINKKGKLIFIKNVFSIPDKVEKVSSVLQMEYEVFVPKNSRIYVANEYGENNFKNLTGDIFMIIKHGKIQLSNLKANTSIRSNFVKITGENLYGRLFLLSENTDVDISNLNNRSNIKIKTGKFFATAGNKMEDVKINAEYCEVKLINPNINNYNYSLKAEYSSLELPIKKFETRYIQENSKETFEYLIDENKPMIRIATSFNKIKILEQ